MELGSRMAYIEQFINVGNHTTLQKFCDLKVLFWKEYYFYHVWLGAPFPFIGEMYPPPLFGYNNLLSYLNTYVCTIYLYILDICRLTFSFCYLDQITVALVRPAQILFYIFFRKHNIIVIASHSLYFQMWEIIFSCENELSSKNILGIQ